MARTIYEKPTRELLIEMLDQRQLGPADVISIQEILQWFETHYPKLRPTGIKGYLVQASTNDWGRLNRPSLHTRDDVLLKVGPGQFRRYDPSRDPPPLHPPS